MTENSYRKKDPAADYQRKLALLFDVETPKPVRFTPQEYLKLMVDHHGMQGIVFSHLVLGRKTDAVRDIFRSTGARLPVDIAQALASHAVDESQRSPAYWLQSEYLVSKASELPKLTIPAPHLQPDWQDTIQQPTNRHKGR